MKKNIIIAAIAAASALLLSVSCQKENQPESQNGINGGANTFTATIEQSLTKTTVTKIDGTYKVSWSDGDQISINGKIYTASPKGDDATKANFTAEDGEATPDVDNEYKAVFPSSLYVTDHFELPATQIYDEDHFNAPMYAAGPSKSLIFKNICDVLAITVNKDSLVSTTTTSLKSIKVSSDKRMHGAFTATSAGVLSFTSQAALTDTDKSVTLTMTDAVDISTDKTFYIAIPAQDYSYLKIYLSADGSTYKEAMITKKAEGLGTISVNTIYEINYETNAVQLYADGPYWATCNIGADNPTEAGWYFSFGNTKGYVLVNGRFVLGSNHEEPLGEDGKFSSENYTNTPGYNLPTSSTFTPGVLNDAAYANWGEAWRVPTGGGGTSDGNALYDGTTRSATNISGVNVMKFQGKGSYEDVFVFFPYSGFADQSAVYYNGSAYWTSTKDTANGIYLSLNGNTYGQNNNHGSSSGNAIRPVSD